MGMRNDKKRKFFFFAWFIHIKKVEISPIRLLYGTQLNIKHNKKGKKVFLWRFFFVEIFIFIIYGFVFSWRERKKKMKPEKPNYTFRTCKNFTANKSSFNGCSGSFFYMNMTHIILKSFPFFHLTIFFVCSFNFLKMVLWR